MQQVISTHKIHVIRNDSYATGNSVSIGLNNKFMTWCELQQGNRFFWLAFAFMTGIGAVLPITLAAIVFIGGNDISLWIIACVVNVPILVVNLALESTKITLPVLFVAWIVDALIITYCLVQFFVK